MSLLLLRHCQSTGDLPESDLTPAGHRSAARLADLLILFDPDAIYASPYARAMATVSPLALRLKAEIRIDDRLRERVRSSEDIEDVAGFLEHSFGDEDYRAVGGESLRQAADRGLATLRDIRRAGHRSVVVASHRTLVAAVLRSIDPGFGLAEWREMMTPDVFRLRFEDLRPVAFERLW